MKPVQHLDYYSNLYPNAWKIIDQYRAAKETALPMWPDWCFIPLAAAYTVVSTEAENQRIDIACDNGFPLLNDVSIIGALAAWRVTQRIYQFDQDVFQTIIETPLNDDLPRDILFNLPEWCVYIKTPGLIIENEELDGFFAYLDFDTDEKKSELRIVFDYNRPAPSLYSIPIPLGDWSLTEALQKTLDKALQRSENMDFDIQPMLERMNKSLSAILSLIIYLCSENSEFGKKGKKPSKPSMKKTPPNQPKVWDVGMLTGAAMREAAEQSINSTSPAQHDAYWRGYWSEQPDGDQQYILKWISPFTVEDKNDISYN